MRKTIVIANSIVTILCLSAAVFADIKIKQRVTMGAGQSMESTKLIKGARERTETRMDFGTAEAAEYYPQIATITQCDLRRTVKLNDRKQLYLIEPFADTSATSAKSPVAAPQANMITRRGGTMIMTVSMRDTGERKQMFGLLARHLIITEEMESSVDSCNGPSKSKIEFDGWYVDLSADFNCPVDVPAAPVGMSKPDCVDRIITKRTGTARPGFLLDGTMKMFDANGGVQMTQTTQTLELSRSPLDASLFDLPKGYRQATNQQDLYALSSMADITNGRTNDTVPPVPARQPITTLRTVAVNITYAPGVMADQEAISNYVRGKVTQRRLNAVSYGTADYTLNIEFRQFRESAAGKIGGIFGKVTGVETKAGKVDVDMTASLSGPGTSTTQSKVKNKFDGPAANAVRVALDQALDQLLSGIGN